MTQALKYLLIQTLIECQRHQTPFPPNKPSSSLLFPSPEIIKMLYASVFCLSWAIASLPLTHCIPVGGPSQQELVDVVGAPTDDVSCPVRKLTLENPLPGSVN